uniref:Glycosyltransferase family 2 protein n=1 Tax=Acidobacterium capsulatum TaxID=33075 RepID=A0A7V5CUW9_9BACT
MPETRSETERPFVSVVLPTAGRSPWLGHAVRSALAQTYAALEVVLVDDSREGQADQPWNLLWAGEERVRVLRTGGIGGAAARRAGVEAARGEWIAFLDDDDEWLPEKIARQMEAAQISAPARGHVVMACRQWVRTAASEYLFPRRVYDGVEPMASYLFCRRGFTQGGGFLQTSTLVAPRALLLETPFRAGLRVHQDWDWLLRVARRGDVRVRVLEEALAVYRTEDGRETVSQRPDWRASLDWIREHRGRIDPRAYSWFVAVQCVWKARAAGTPLRAWAEIARAFVAEGRPGLRSALYFLGFAVFPVGWRKSLRNRMWRVKREERNLWALMLRW